MRSALLLGRDHQAIGAVAAVAEGPAAITLSRGGARKTYEYTEPNEDAALFAIGPGGWLIAVADGHYGASGSQAALEHLESSWAPTWTSADSPITCEEAWDEIALDALDGCNRAVLARGAELELPPAPTTLALALIRPAQALAAHACMGDSHIFRVDDRAAQELGWASLERDRTYFLGYEGGPRGSKSGMSLIGCSALAGARAIVLATDGLSEIGIGVASPADAVHQAVTDAGSAAPELRALTACKRVGQAALDAHRANESGDNIGCAVLWLAD